MFSSPSFYLEPSKIPSQPDFSGMHQPVLKVMGLGGGGCNAINRMIELGLEGVDFIAANTDHQALKSCLAPVKIQLGPACTRGLGAGGNPAMGKTAAEESYKEIAAALQGADMVFLTAGMGGGTGTGSIPIAAKIARAQGAVTIAIVTLPFDFEVGRRQRNANEGIAALRLNTDTLICIPNNQLLYVAPANLSLETAFRLADDVLRQAVQGITELIREPGIINVDFANVRHLMKLGGGALMAIGQGQGENKAHDALDQAMHHPLLGNTSLQNAAGILVNFTCGQDLTLFEVNDAISKMQEETGPQAEIVVGVTNDERMRDRAQVILVATGLGATPLEEAMASVKPAVQAPVERRMVEKPAPLQQKQAPEPLRRPITPPRVLEMQAQSPVSSAQNLDLPAFLRRRS